DRHTMTFAMAFDSPAAASQQIQVRRDLSSGPFIGRGGQIEEALVLQNARTDEDTGVLRFRHDVETDAFMAAVGPVIFASCAPPHYRRSATYSRRSGTYSRRSGTYSGPGSRLVDNFMQNFAICG